MQSSKTEIALALMKAMSAQTNIPVWLHNIGKNLPKVRWPYTDAPVEWKDTVVIFASGASLARFRGQYAGINKVATIIATPTNVAWLRSEGVDIDLVVVLDAHPSMGEMLKDYDGPVIAHSGVHPSVLEKDTYFYKLYIGTAKDDDPAFGIWNQMQNYMFPQLVSGYSAEFGCVTNMALAVASDLAQRRIVLAGADYAYWSGFGRIGVEMEPAPEDFDAIRWRGYQTNSRMVSYKDSLMKILIKVTRSFPVYLMAEGIIDEARLININNIHMEDYPPPLPWEEFVELARKHIEEFKEFGEAVGVETE